MASKNKSHYLWNKMISKRRAQILAKGKDIITEASLLVIYLRTSTGLHVYNKIFYPRLKKVLLKKAKANC